mgnify:CR=1 FL=1
MIFIASLGFSQNNLVFNRVLEMYLTTTVSATVPEGKVWKVENSSSNLLVDKPNVDYGLPLSNAPFAQGTGAINWFSENTVIKASGSSGARISVLEFNVVPTSTGSGTGGGGVSSDGLVFSQMINEAIVITQTNNWGTVLYSFNIPAGHIWKIRRMTQRYWNQVVMEFQDNLANGRILISVNGQPFIDQNPFVNSTSSYEVYLKEGSYEITWYPGSSGFSGNRIFLEAIDYIIPQ